MLTTRHIGAFMFLIEAENKRILHTRRLSKPPAINGKLLEKTLKQIGKLDRNYYRGNHFIEGTSKESNRGGTSNRNGRKNKRLRPSATFVFCNQYRPNNYND